MKQYEFHPLAGVFPLMTLTQRNELFNDIKKNGQLEPIGVFEGKILDGRNRYLACRQGGIEAKFIELSPKDAKVFIMSKNYFRRHLGHEEKKAIMVRMIAQQESLQMTNNDIAKAADVSVDTVKREKRKNRGKRGGLHHISENGSKKSEPSKPDIIMDDAGVPVPEPAMEYWSRKSEALQIMNQLRACKGFVKKLIPDDIMWIEVTLSGVAGDIENAISRFRGAVPAHVCPKCKGLKPEGCDTCRGRGVVSEYFWRHAIPAEMKK